MKENKHNFHDINKFPRDYGILLFPISISRAENSKGQDPRQCLEFLNYFSPSKVSEPKIGLNMIYGDFLYMHSNEPASALKKKFMSIVLKHKNAFSKLIFTNRDRFQIQHAFSCQVWNQLYLCYQGDFSSDFNKLKKIYSADPLFQKYVKEDSELSGRDINDNQINFFLEEHLMFYFLMKRQVYIPNEYVMGREKWVLNCYPGPPLKAEIYLHQLDPFKLSAPENPYQSHFYDLDKKILTNLLEVDLEKYNYKYPEK